MKELLRIAEKAADEAEVFFVRNDASSLSMRNGRTTETSSTIQSGYALRLLKDGKIGTAYTKNLLDRQELVDNALNSLKGNVEAGFSFPGPEDIPEPDAVDPSIEKLGFEDLHEKADKVLQHMKDDVEGQIDVHSGRGTSETSVVNSSGLEVSSASAMMYTYTSLLYPNSETAVRKVHKSSSVEDFPPDKLDELVALYREGLPEVDVPTGKMKVVFTPDTMYTLLWRLKAATSGKSFHNGISPLQDRRGTAVLSKKFSLYGDPTDDENIEKRFFDDEGVATGRHMVFESGVFRNLILNLDYADKLGEKPTGTGYRGGMWGGETVSMQPVPTLASARIAPGDVSFRDMISGMDRGVIVLGVLGAHSGNILNGDFSIGLNPGFYVEGGKIRGRVKDGMTAGNVYEVLQNIEAIENRTHDSSMGGRFPSIMLESVSVAAK